MFGEMWVIGVRGQRLMEKLGLALSLGVRPFDQGPDALPNSLLNNNINSSLTSLHSIAIAKYLGVLGNGNSWG